jgi:hypothetical protein
VKKIISIRVLGLIFLSVIFIIYSCSKGGGGGTTPAPDPCAGVTITVTGTVVNPSSPGVNDGSITATGTGGSGLTFSINGRTFQASGNFTGLGPGSYTIVAKNGNGCSGSATFTLTAPNPCAGVTIIVTATIVNPTIGNNIGSITAIASGGTSGFTYSINGGVFQASGTFSNLGAGNYTITAKNASGCTGSAVFTLVATNPCAGVTINVTGTITNPTAPGATNGSIAASASGGAGGFTFSINGGAFQASGTFSSLGAGTFTIVAKDANGCSGSAAFTLIDPNPCAGVTITVTNAVTGNTPCQSPPTGSITVTPGGGTGPYTFKLNSGSFQSSNVFSNLVAGTYSITAKDVNGCTGSNSATVVDLPAGPLFSAVKLLLQNNCVSCHNSGNPQGGMNWTIDCNIVTFKNNIKLRAVDGIPSPMPPSGLLSSSERQKITDWINAGGRFSD